MSPHALGVGQLPHLERFNDKRRQLVARYFEHWGKEAPVRLPARGDQGHSWHMFAPLLPLGPGLTRLGFMEAMKAKGIGVGVHYPALHLFSRVCEFAVSGRDVPQLRSGSDVRR